MAVRTSALSSFVDKNNVATESEMNGTKANPVSLIRIGSKVFPEQKFDKYQNFAVQNGKYVFADVKTFDIIPKEDITDEDDGIRIKASEADTSACRFLLQVAFSQSNSRPFSSFLPPIVLL